MLVVGAGPVGLTAACLGVLPRLEARGRRIAALEMVDGRAGESRARLDLAEAPTRHPYVLDVAQPDTEAVLAELVADTADPQLLRRHLAGALHLREPSTA